MKIAIDIRPLLENRFGGVKHYTQNIIQSLIAAAPKDSFHLFYNAANSRAIPAFGKNVSVHSFHWPNKFFQATQGFLGWPRWDRLLPQVDVFFSPSLGLVPLLPTTPLVATFHDLSYERFPEFFDSKRRAWHSFTKPRQLAGRADAIIAVSRHTAWDLKTLYRVPSEKITVIYSGVDALVQAAASKVSEKIKKLPRPFVLYLGTLEPRKNVASAIRAFAAIRESIPHHLVIAGERGWKTKDIEASLAECGTTRIHLIGSVTEAEKSALYSAADLFVYPSFYEGFGFPPLEALAAGVPVVTSFNSALPEVIGQWATLVNPYDVSELALVLKELLQDLPQVPFDVREEVIKKYSWKTSAQETLRILRSVA